MLTDSTLNALGLALVAFWVIGFIIFSIGYLSLGRAESPAELDESDD